MLIALASALLFVGYNLVYAAVHNGGEFAAKPWDAIFPQSQAPVVSLKQAAAGKPVGRTRPGG